MAPCSYGLERALYEALCMCFSTVLHSACAELLLPDLHKAATFDVLRSTLQRSVLGQTIFSAVKPDRLRQIMATAAAEAAEAERFVKFGDMWLPAGPLPKFVDERFITTKSVAFQMRNLGRAVVAAKYPVLLQGPTSAGKTSMVQHLAGLTGHKYVRINNHAHTDVQEYLGTYLTDTTGKLTFQEGVLVQAVRLGHWLLLDELNLAPSEVLEVLNRLLDDNRELFVPDTHETVKPHPSFMLFATQNPAGLYGGRKVLSRAFRNRFLEMHVGEIDEDELEEILHKRCEIPESYAKKLIGVMRELQRIRHDGRVFAGKAGYITPRDLFRWADRKPFDDYQHLAEEGYRILA